MKPTTAPSCRRATHRGTCQICGSVQLLPSGCLSLHGYTVQWGFFAGVCRGANRLPFEQSTDAIADAVAAVERQIAETEAEIAGYEDLGNPANDGTSVWMRLYTDNAYRWTRVRLHDFATDRTTYAGQLSSCRYSTLRPVFAQGKAETLTGRVEAYEETWTMHSLQEWARFLNRKYARELAHTNDRRREWLQWQQTRLAGWSPAALIPRKP